MLRLLSVASLFLLASAARQGVLDYGYEPCEGRYVGNGYYNLAGERSYNRQVELVCDFRRSRSYDRVTDIAWIKLDDYGSCRRAEAIRGRPTVITRRDKSVLTIPLHDSRDHGVYRCFGTVRSGYNRIGRRVVYMDVPFLPRSYRYAPDFY
ncbi:hypothetical protein FJT64_013972 [Amphibalanus amphitrite]|uniref:Ig-like domain-containing protein n=1 Tax=Amphibalanus amphitrite TaxID=1232801 RepID=A0A6A4V0V1_AMPAM|nr:hypothetical protein FJT64_013972 [Amphibalanus amphitrite]